MESALSAPVIGHFQMDSGAVAGEPHSVLQLSKNSLLRAFLSLGEIIGIMDHLIMLEKMWLSGASTHQTILTNVYMLRPDLAPPPLKCFCLSILLLMEELKDISYVTQIATVCFFVFIF